MNQRLRSHPQLLPSSEILHAVRGESGRKISHALRAELNAGTISDAMRIESSVAVTLPAIGHALRGESWQPGQLHPNLSWTHYNKGVGQSKTGGEA